MDGNKLEQNRDSSDGRVPLPCNTAASWMIATQGFPSEHELSFFYGLYSKLWVFNSMCAGSCELNPGLQASQARTIAPDCSLTHGSTPNATPILIFDAEMFVSLQEVFSYMEILRTAWLTRQNRKSISWGRLLEKGQEEYGLGFSSSSIRADLGLVLRAFFFESWRREPE